MGIGISIFLIAVGAVFAFAVNLPVTGVDLNVVGAILMGVGFATLLYTLVWWSDAMPWRRDQTVIRARYVEPDVSGHYPPATPIRRERITEYERRAS